MTKMKLVKAWNRPMSRRALSVGLVLLHALVVVELSGATEPVQFAALSYHEVTDGTAITARAGITTDMLVGHFDWLHGNGYTPVSVQDLVDARDGLRALPEHPVLLSFDDGYTSFYTHVLPLLKAYEYPAVIALVGKFMAPAADAMVPYGSAFLPRSAFMTWEQVREAQASGLVEVGSHTRNLHRGAVANPQGNALPAAHVYRYDADIAEYEDDAAFRARLTHDFDASAEQILKNTGRRPRVMVWPYGAYGTVSADLAAAAGMPITLTLDGGKSTLDELGAIRRYLVAADWRIDTLADALRNVEPLPAPIRVVHVDLDYIWDQDPAVQERNLGLLLERIKAFHINTVYLQAYSDVDGDSVAESLYFPNRHLPVKADLFGRAAWQLRTRAGVTVFAWLPVLAFEHDDERLLVQRWNAEDGSVQVDPDKPKRLSPWQPEARKIVAEIYEDLSRHAKFGGVLFSDDAVLTDFEDAGSAALAAFAEVEGAPLTVKQIRADPALAARWTQYKSESLTTFTKMLHGVVERYQGRVLTARNLFARPVLQPESQAWFAQNLGDFVKAYDQVPLMAMPYMEEARDPAAWLQRLLLAVKREPGALGKVVFEFQTVDWRTPRRDLPTSELAATMKSFQRQGAIHFGYYPDDFHNNHPQAEILHPAFSLQWFPFD